MGPLECAGTREHTAVPPSLQGASTPPPMLLQIRLRVPQISSEEPLPNDLKKLFNPKGHLHKPKCRHFNRQVTREGSKRPSLGIVELRGVRSVLCCIASLHISRLKIEFLILRIQFLFPVLMSSSYIEFTLERTGAQHSQSPRPSQGGAESRQVPPALLLGPMWHFLTASIPGEAGVPDGLHTRPLTRGTCRRGSPGDAVSER